MTQSLTHPHQWQFWVDRGGTFTDIVAQRPDGSIVLHKLLSEDPDRYEDAPLQGIRDLLGLRADAPIPSAAIAAIKMGTTVATNALLERKGEPTLLITTAGFGDALSIGYQNRPDIFALNIRKPEQLYDRVLEVAERVMADGTVLTSLTAEIEADYCLRLREIYATGIRACAIVLMHGYRYPNHELRLAALAQDIGFTQISISHQVSPLIKLVGRGDTTVVDAYLSPVLRRYVDRLTEAIPLAKPLCQSSSKMRELGSNTDVQITPTQLLFMQSNGGLTDATQFQGKDSILSGPAGGIVGAVQTTQLAGFDRIITFDMGGTSTDVAHFAGDYEREFETEVAGIRLRAPMLAIHTVAAGGGSIVQFDGSRYRVGPASAGANPGPASYGRGGPLTVTDCNVQVGKLQPDFFPQIFGPAGNQPLDRDIVNQQFLALADRLSQTTDQPQSPEQIATGFLTIAIDNMANAIKKISVQRGYDIADYVLCCFGGAGGQHACLLADVLGMTTIVIHPYAGVLSAYGMGLADRRLLREKSIEQSLDSGLDSVRESLDRLTQDTIAKLQKQVGTNSEIQVEQRLLIRYDGTSASLSVLVADRAQIEQQFTTDYRQRFGFTLSQKSLIVEAITVEAIAKTIAPNLVFHPATEVAAPIDHVEIFCADRWQRSPVYQRELLAVNQVISGPAIILEGTGTNMVEPGWSGHISPIGDLILSRDAVIQSIDQSTELTADPVRLELFNNRFQSIAEQMGITLQNTSTSVNIKERLDFSCALFDPQGQLIANAPHIPVHLGSMGETISALIRDWGDRADQSPDRTIQPGDVFVGNDPYNGGTHLPDITVITPVFITQNRTKPTFFVASRGHHADIGGITPGSMPANSKSIVEEGIRLETVKLVDRGQFQEKNLRDRLANNPYPARNPDQNIADLQAQIAANAKGAQELQATVDHYGPATVIAYMAHIQDNAELAVRQAIGLLYNSGPADRSFEVPMDNGAIIRVRIQLQPDAATIDFTGTSPQQPTNFNAPLAISKAAVLYVFRSLVSEPIPLNAGCLRPLTLIVPAGSLLNPIAPAAVVAGNVETSQAIVDALYGALGILAASQGTMNNFTFGTEQFQYYETICGGAGAGATFAGADAVQTHMTNSRLTDPEVLELRFPVLLESFSLRSGSGGSGRQRGGQGVRRCLRALAPMTAGILAGRRIHRPFGLAGGGDGALGKTEVVRANGDRIILGSTATIELQTGDQITIETPGGGGFGSV
jgi:5-oxoprolinase (ATP-hydrolysing)